MRNYIQDGDVIPVVAPYDLASGDGCLVGTLFGVATGPAKIGTNFDLITEGVFDLVAVSSDVDVQGADAYWDNAVRKVTTVSSGNTAIGKLTVAKNTGDATARVTLLPVGNSNSQNTGSNVSSVAWSTSWDTAGAKDKGDFIISAALAITSTDVGSVVGGYTQATLIADGVHVPTFDGSTIADYINTAGTRNLVQMFRAGNTKYWAIGSRTGTAIASAATALTASGPSSGVVSVASSTITVQANGILSSSVTVTPSSNVAGSFSPSSATLTNGGSVTFTYTPTATGSATLTFAASGLTSATLGYTISAAATAPGVPTGLTLGTPTSTTQPLTWAAPASDGGSAITDYVLQYSTDNATWSTFADGTSTVAAATVTGLTASTLYYYRVAAVNAVGQGAYTASSSGSTAAASSTVRLTSLNSTLESGTGPYTYTGQGGGFATPCGGVTTTALQSGVDGYVGYIVGAWNGSTTYESLIGLATTNTRTAYTSLPYAFYTQSSSGKYVPFTGGSQGTPAANITPAVGDYVRLRRTGTTLYAEVSKDSGATYTVIYSWTGVSTGVLWFDLAPSGSAVLSNLFGSGLA